MSTEAHISMTDLHAVADLVEIQPDSTVSRTVLTAEGLRIVMFAFDAGQELTEHTAAVPVMLQCIRGAFDITADDRTTTLAPGDVIHLGTRTPHAVLAKEPSKLLLAMLDPRLS